MSNPVLFYFWAHSNIEELKTPTLTELVKRADVIFKELVSSDMDITAEIEGDCNEYSLNGKISEKLRSQINHPASEEDRFLFGLTKGTNKRYRFERTKTAPFRWDRKKEVARMLLWIIR